MKCTTANKTTSSQDQLQLFILSIAFTEISGVSKLTAFSTAAGMLFISLEKEKQTKPWLEFEISKCELQMVKLGFNKKRHFWFGYVLQYEPAAHVWGSVCCRSQLNNLSAITERMIILLGEDFMHTSAKVYWDEKLKRTRKVFFCLFVCFFLK